jgi:hypothetical protein
MTRRYDMMDDSNLSERPRLEPEIIPPERDRHNSDWRWRPYGPSMAGETQRIYVRRLGPFGFGVLMLIVGFVVAAVLFAVVGAVLLWIPILVLLLAAGAIIRLLRWRTTA